VNGPVGELLTATWNFTLEVPGVVASHWMLSHVTLRPAS
jgi:hypothetical protein